MPINTVQTLQLINHLAEHEGLRVAVNETTKAAFIIGGSVFVAGIVGGPVGILAGGIISSVIVYARGRGKYKSVVEIIANDMTPAQRNKLAESVIKIVQDSGIEDLTILFSMAVHIEAINVLIIKEVVRFIGTEMRLAIASS